MNDPVQGNAVFHPPNTRDYTITSLYKNQQNDVVKHNLCPQEYVLSEIDLMFGLRWSFARMNVLK